MLRNFSLNQGNLIGWMIMEDLNRPTNSEDELVTHKGNFAR